MFRSLRPRSDTTVPAVANTAIVRRSRAESLDVVVSAFESETSALFARTAPRNEHTVLYVLAGMLVLAIIFMSVVKLDRVVTGLGRIVPTAGSIYVQSLNESVVRRIYVKVGDFVRKGQTLAALDPTFAAAALAQDQKKVDSDEAQLQRDQAEVNGADYAPKSNNPYERMQRNIWDRRQAEYKSSVASFDAQIANSAATAALLGKDIASYTKRLELASEVEKMDSTLEQKGWGSRLKTLTSTDTRVEVGRLLADSRDQLSATRQTMESLKAQRSAYIEKWHSEAGTDLVTTRNDLDKTTEDLRTARKLKDMTDITAPVDAVVVKIGKTSQGSVTGPNSDVNQQDPLFTLVPAGGQLEADINIATGDEGFLKSGQPVTIKLDAYRFLQHGTAKGVLKAITESSFKVDEDTNQPVSPYIQGRVAITDVHLRDVPSDFRLIPGMTITADILVGRRTIMSYLVEGIMRTSTEAMREP